MKNTEQNTDNKILQIIKEFGAQYHYKFPTVIEPKHHLSHDLGLDSLGQLELCMKIESELGITMKDDDVDSFKTVAQIINCVNGLAA